MGKRPVNVNAVAARTSKRTIFAAARAAGFKSAGPAGRPERFTHRKTPISAHCGFDARQTA